MSSRTVDSDSGLGFERSRFCLVHVDRPSWRRTCRKKNVSGVTVSGSKFRRLCCRVRAKRYEVYVTEPDLRGCFSFSVGTKLSIFISRLLIVGPLLSTGSPMVPAGEQCIYNNSCIFCPRRTSRSLECTKECLRFPRASDPSKLTGRNRNSSVYRTQTRHA